MNKLHISFVCAAASVIGAFAASGAQAGVEFVTPINDCHNVVDRIGDGKNLSIIADQDVRFEVWGFQMDFSTDVRVAVDGVPGNIGARIVRTRSGADNLARGCPFAGSVEVEVDTPATFTANRFRSLFFKTNVLGFVSEHRLRLTVKPYPRFSAAWVFEDANCIVKSGSIQRDQQDTRIVLNLPPGHGQDASTCNAHLTAQVKPQEMGELDIFKRFTYSLSGLPTFLTVTPSNTQPKADAVLSFAIDTARIRRLATTSNSNLRIRSPNSHRTDRLSLVVVPNRDNGFVAQAACDPNPIEIQGVSNCTLRLASPAPAAGQVITWRMNQKTCFGGAPDSDPNYAPGVSSYDLGSSFQHFRFPGNQTVAAIQVRSVTGEGCANLTGVAHFFEAWLGDDDHGLHPEVTAPVSGPTYTKTTLAVVRPAT